MAQPSAGLPVIDEGSGGDLHDVAFFRRRYCCYVNLTSFESNNWQRISLLSGERESVNDRNWWRKGIDALKKVREWSEVVAGPKWKTFIRRFKGRARSSRFRYDPSSYSLNFDEGHWHNADFESDLTFPDFSSRYSAIPMQLKDSMSSTWSRAG